MADVAADRRGLSGQRVRRPHAFAALTAVLAAAALAVLAAFLLLPAGTDRPTAPLPSFLAAELGPATASARPAAGAVPRSRESRSPGRVFAQGEARDCRSLKHLISRAREAEGETWRASGICGFGGAWLVPGAAA